MLIGYLVDGQYVSVNRLQHFLIHFGGKTLELLFK